LSYGATRGIKAQNEVFMKKLLVLSILFTNFTWASIFIDKPVYDEIENSGINNTAASLIITIIEDSYPEYGLGDDGKDCPTEISEIEIEKVSSSKIAFKFIAQQDYTATYGCMDIPAECFSIIEMKGGKVSSSTMCEFVF
jgi:hypothetical protein